jgi:hypothetical protein
MTQSFNPLSRPPEGVIRGEDVPVENQDFEELEVKKAMAKMRGHKAYRQMSDSELRDKARGFIEKHRS